MWVQTWSAVFHALLKNLLRRVEHGLYTHVPHILEMSRQNSEKKTRLLQGAKWVLKKMKRGLNVVLKKMKDGYTDHKTRGGGVSTLAGACSSQLDDMRESKWVL